MTFGSFILSSLLVLSQNQEPQFVNLEVSVENFKNKNGTLIVALFNNKEGFLKKDYLNKSLELNDSTDASVSFQNLMPGNYSISIIHDENDNGKLDTNFFGIPIEGFGFSNNKLGAFGPPSFEECIVDVTSSTKITIEVKKIL